MGTNRLETAVNPAPLKPQHAPIDPQREEALRKAKWRRGLEPRGGIGGSRGHGSGRGPNLPLRHHQVHGRGN